MKSGRERITPIFVKYRTYGSLDIGTEMSNGSVIIGHEVYKKRLFLPNIILNIACLLYAERRGKNKNCCRCELYYDQVKCPLDLRIKTCRATLQNLMLETPK